MSQSTISSVSNSSPSPYTLPPGFNNDDNASISSANSRFSSLSSNYSYRFNKPHYRSDTDLIATPHGKHTMNELLSMRIFSEEPQIFVIDFPITDEKTLLSKAYFGQFGAIKNFSFFKNRSKTVIKHSFYIQFTTTTAAKDAIDHCNYNKWKFDINTASAQWSTKKYCSHFLRCGSCKYGSKCLFQNEWAKPWQIIGKNNYKKVSYSVSEEKNSSVDGIRKLLKQLNYCKSEIAKLNKENAALRTQNNVLKVAQNMDEDRLQFVKWVQDTCSTAHFPDYLASYLFN